MFETRNHKWITDPILTMVSFGDVWGVFNNKGKGSLSKTNMDGEPTTNM